MYVYTYIHVVYMYARYRDILIVVWDGVGVVGRHKSVPANYASKYSVTLIDGDIKDNDNNHLLFFDALLLPLNE